MSVFGTEFPVRGDFSKAEFVAHVVAWLRGIENSRVFEANENSDIDGASGHFKAENGEELTFREVDGSSGYVVGAKHEIPDLEGRIWRTEIVVRKDASGNSIMRIGSRCISNQNGARLDTPRRPHIIRSVIEDGVAKSDGYLDTLLEPIVLNEKLNEDVDLATKIVDGSATNFLPVLYFSVDSRERCCLSDDLLRKFAKSVGGVCHVVVEPSRAFSFMLRDRSRGRNVYGGAVGLSVPGRGIVGKFFLGWQAPDVRALSERLRNVVTSARSRMKSLGWEWADLQEYYLKEERRKEQNRLSESEKYQLYDEELKNKDEIISNLRASIESLRGDAVQSDSLSDELILNGEFIGAIGREMYPGEFSDRVRLALISFVERAKDFGFDQRTIFIISQIIEKSAYSDDLKEIKSDLKRAEKGGSIDFCTILSEIGYIKSNEKKHIKMTPSDFFDGLPVITIPKTPSDYRGPKNMLSDIEKNIGISKMKF